MISSIDNLLVGQCLDSSDVQQLVVGDVISARWCGDASIVMEIVSIHVCADGSRQPKFLNCSVIGPMTHYIVPEMDKWGAWLISDGLIESWHSALLVRKASVQTTAVSADTSDGDRRLSTRAALLLLREQLDTVRRMSELLRDKLDDQMSGTVAGGAAELMVVDEVLMRETVKDLQYVQAYCQRIGALVLK